LRCDSFCASASAKKFPQRDQRQEIGALVAKFEVRLIGRLRASSGRSRRIGHRERARDDERLRHAAAIPRRLEDAADPRIERQLRELAPARGQRTGRIDGVQFLQQLVAIRNGARRRRLDERKSFTAPSIPATPSAGSPTQASCGEFRIGITRPRAKSSSIVEAYADAVGNSAASPRALIRRACAIFSICSSVVLLRKL
jgi:hypothetical protein